MNPSFAKARQMSLGSHGIDVPTDDWPYLYLCKKTIPGDHLVVIVVLLMLSVLTVLSLRGKGVGLDDGHFMLSGVGFLLLQTKSIADCSHYFGTTWVVTMLVVAGVLLMALAANFVAVRARRSR